MVIVIMGETVTRRHCRLSICEYELDNYSIRAKDPNIHSDTEKGTLSILGMPYLVLAL